MMQHRGYFGDAWIDSDAGVIRGEVIGIRDMITFQGATVEEARREFVESVEDYLAFCAERGEVPEQPFSGKFMVRIGPELHRNLALSAKRSGVSLNSFVIDQLANSVEDDSFRATHARRRRVSGVTRHPKNKESAASAAKRSGSIQGKRRDTEQTAIVRSGKRPADPTRLQVPSPGRTTRISSKKK